MRYPDSPTPDSLEQGKAFEHFVIQWANSKYSCEVWRPCTTFEEQVTIGDAIDLNGKGVEIKLDKRCTETGRLSIEIAERTSLARAWRWSGVFSAAKAEYYVQGNFTRFWVFRRRALQRHFLTGPREFIPESTIQKFYIPIAQLEAGRPPVVAEFADLRLAERPAVYGGSAAG